MTMEFANTLKLKKKTTDIFETMGGPAVILEAVQTEDPIGTILRFHLHFELMLSLYLSEVISDDEGPYIGEPRDYAAKLRLAVAYKLPLSLAAVFRQVNNIRNKVAHNHREVLGSGDVEQLKRLVDALSALNPKLLPTESRRLSIKSSGGGDAEISYGENLRYDFVMCCMTFYGEAMKYILMCFARMSGAN